MSSRCCSQQKGLEQEAVPIAGGGSAAAPLPAIQYVTPTCCFRTGHLAEADQTYRDFLAIGPTVSMALNNRGLVLINQNATEAAGRFEMALRVAPENQLAADNLRLVREQLQAGGAEKEGGGRPALVGVGGDVVSLRTASRTTAGGPPCSARFRYWGLSGLSFLSSFRLRGGVHSTAFHDVEFALVDPAGFSSSSRCQSVPAGASVPC